MYTELPWSPSGAAAAVTAGTAGALAGSAAADRSKWVSQKDFDALCNKQRSAVAKPGFSDALTAALHDKECK